MSDERAIFNGPQENPRDFAARLLLYRGLLHFVACRVLRSCEGADEAVERCLLNAGGDRHEFECEGAFRSWLVRILIDEALLILVERKRDLTTSSEQVLAE
jgi:DNA-directed RNA polymerase specialized sigma24 family protein